MCCEECPKYARCEEANRLKDNCCSRCPEYYDCAGSDDRERDSYKDSYRDGNAEGYFQE